MLQLQLGFGATDEDHRCRADRAPHRRPRCDPGGWTQDAFLVRVHTDEGIVGLGEADTSPYVARTIVEMPSSHSIARGLREVLVGEDPLQADRLWQLMFEASDHYGRGGAALHTISAIDIALWDIAGRLPAGRSTSCSGVGGVEISACTRAR